MSNRIVFSDISDSPHHLASALLFFWSLQCIAFSSHSSSRMLQPVLPSSVQDGVDLPALHPPVACWLLIPDSETWCTKLLREVHSHTIPLLTVQPYTSVHALRHFLSWGDLVSYNFTYWDFLSHNSWYTLKITGLKFERFKKH